MRGHEPLPSSVNRDTPSRDSAGLLLRRLRSGRCRIRRSRRLALRQRSARRRPDHTWADSSSSAAPARPAPAGSDTAAHRGAWKTLSIEHPGPCLLVPVPQLLVHETGMGQPQLRSASTWDELHGHHRSTLRRPRHRPGRGGRPRTSVRGEHAPCGPLEPAVRQHLSDVPAAAMHQNHRRTRALYNR